MPKKKPEQEAQERPPVQKIYVHHVYNEKGCLMGIIEGALLAALILTSLGMFGSLLSEVNIKKWLIIIFIAWTVYRLWINRDRIRNKFK